MQTVLEEIAHFVSTTTYQHLPEKVISAAILGLTDYSACALAGACAAVSENVLIYLKASGLKEGCCSLFGTSARTDVKSAGFFNGVSSHSMDFDDVSWATIGHPSVSTAPAVFACAQAGGWDGKKTLLAYVLAIETMHQIAALTMPQLSERGWHTTLTYGAFGAVIPAALLLGLSQEKLIYALGIAASRCGGVRANFGTQTKALHAGLANRIGIDSAQLSSFGITSSASAIEGQDGFAQCFTGEDIHGKIYLGKKMGSRRKRFSH